jgi:hypothetical protein
MTRSALFLCVVLFAGCAGFRGGNLGTLEAWPPEPAAAKKTVGITLKGPKGELAKAWALQAGKAFHDSGLCAEISCPPDGDEQLQVELAIEDVDKSSGLLNFLSIITLTIIPAKSTDEYTVVTTFKERDGKLLGSVTKKEKVTTWQELLLIFLTPFKSPGKVMDRAYYDITRATIVDARNLFAGTEKEKKPAPGKLLTPQARRTIDAHRQRYGMSCIPMSIEMVLKLLGRVPPEYYDLQDARKNKADGNFRDFDGKTIHGVTFHQQFALPRNDRFPLKKLFATIDDELNAGRYVIISLMSGNGWHMWVICDRTLDGDFVAFSKVDERTVSADRVNRIVTDMQGTDILTYEIAR